MEKCDILHNFIYLLKKKKTTFFKNRDLGIAKEWFGFLIVIDHHIVITLREREVSSVNDAAQAPLFFKLINRDSLAPPSGWQSSNLCHKTNILYILGNTVLKRKF